MLLAGSIAAIVLKPTRLGLDLAGGIELIYEAQPRDADRAPTSRELQNAIEVVNDRVNALGVTEAEVTAVGDELISIALPDVDDPEEAKALVGSTANMLFYKWEENVVGEEGQSDSITDPEGSSNKGASNQYKAAKLASEQKSPKGATGRDQYYLFDTTKSGKEKLIAGPANSEKELLEEDNKVTGKPLNGEAPENSEVLMVPKGFTVVNYNPQDLKAGGQWFVLKDNVEMTGDRVKSATAGQDQSGAPAVDLAFTGEGGKIFQRVTRELFKEGLEEPVLGDRSAAAHRFAIVLDGKVVSLASIDPSDGSLSEGIAGGRAQITGLSQAESIRIAKQIDLGALPVKLDLVSETRISASLGRQALDQALIASLFGFLLVVMFLCAFYRLLGGIASIALIFYGIFFFAVAKLVGFTFTLPGIAGLVLTLAVAADANIVIFERIKEEVRAGKSMKTAISTGYRKGFSTILDANVVTIIVAFILFVLATSGVRGFAAALGIGTLVSLFTAVVVTSAILGLLSGWKGLERPSALGVNKKNPNKQRWQFDFIGKSRTVFAISGLILVIGGVAVAGIGLNLGIDFTGGTKITVGVEKPVTEEQVRAILDEAGATEAKIQRITGDEVYGENAFQITSDQLDQPDVAGLRTTFDDRFDVIGNSENDLRFEVVTVGPTFGSVVAKSAITAIIFSLIVIGIYVALRFGWKFAVPILIAVAHDLLITFGVYALIDREVTSATVAALLTILGFSLYDTIIVFDRIRENMPRMPRATFSQITNRSMSEVLTRSLATSFVTLLPIASLLIFGGETLRDFAFALLIGTISGTYSSIFIASPVLNAWKEREPIFRQRTARVMEENNGVVPAFATETIGGVAVSSQTSEPLAPEELAAGDEVIEDEVVEETVLNGSVESEDAATASGGVNRPQTKAERRAARAKRKHGR